MQTVHNANSLTRKKQFIKYAENERNPAIYLLSPPTVTYRPSDAQNWLLDEAMDPNALSQTPNLPDLLKSLSSRDDGARKMAAFKLQSLTNDPSFAEHFVIGGGLPKLRLLVLECTGNTLAYGLASFARLLEVDQGWDGVDDAVVEKVSIAP